MSAQDLEQRAREYQHVLDMLGVATHEEAGAEIGRLHAAALRQQAAPVDLEQFRAAICSWRQDAIKRYAETDDYAGRTIMIERKAEADRLLSIINAGKVECAEPVAWITPESIRHLAKMSGPANVVVWNCASGDARVPLYAAPHQPAPVVDGATVSALQSTRDRMMAALTPKFGDAFDGDFDVMLEAINTLKRLRASQLSHAPVVDDAMREGCVGAMTPARAAYFLRRFKTDEKMLGPHEQWALDFAITALGQQPAPVVDDAMVDAAIAAQDAHWANDDNYPARAPRSVKGDARLHDKLARGAMRAALTAALARAQGVQS